MKSILTSILVCIAAISSAQQPVLIIPTPVSVVMQQGHFIVNNQTMINANAATLSEAALLNDYLQKIYGFTLPVVQNAKPGKNHIVLRLAGPSDAKEHYELDVTPSKIIIESADNAGLFYGIQSLLQLLPVTKEGGLSKGFAVPALHIKDEPRFKYRGMHLDVARHFFDVDFIKKYIDYLAYQKFNTFHWHLTDDQGWRIEIKKYPKLTSVGGFRNGTIIGRYPGTGNDEKRYGGFYTQEQIKEVVKYAAARHITVIPEIEMPGHASAAIAAYPQLSCFPDEDTKVPERTTWAGSTKGKHVQQTWGVFEDIFAPTEYTFGFLEDVLDEVIPLFPSPYIHIGGDEAPKKAWERSEYAQKLIKEKGLKDEHELQSYFVQRIEKYLNSKGKKIIGWDEILEGGLAPNATVMSWRGEAGGIAAAKQSHDVIMTPNSYCYFDYSQTKNEDSVTIGGFLTLEKVYSYEPLSTQLTDEQKKFILGAQANLWTEYIEYPSKVEYMIFPRMSALSEVLWRPQGDRDWKQFEARLPHIYKKYRLWGADYFKGN